MGKKIIIQILKEWTAEIATKKELGSDQDQRNNAQYRALVQIC